VIFEERRVHSRSISDSLETLQHFSQGLSEMQVVETSRRIRAEMPTLPLLNALGVTGLRREFAFRANEPPTSIYERRPDFPAILTQSPRCSKRQPRVISRDIEICQEICQAGAPIRTATAILSGND
jgi:hypothetical protein